MTPVGLAADGVFDEQGGQDAALPAVFDDAVLLVGSVLGVGGDAEIGKNLSHGVQILPVCRETPSGGFYCARSVQKKRGCGVRARGWFFSLKQCYPNS